MKLICTRTCSTCRKTVALLEERGVEFTYREYRKDPLSEKEIREVLGLLGMAPREVLRKHDKAYKSLGLTGQESDEILIAAMAEHPTLLQRPIAVVDGKAALGRPPENILDLLP